MSKSAKYYYDVEAIKERAAYPDGPNSPESIASPHGQGFTRRARFNGGGSVDASRHDAGRESQGTSDGMRNKRSVWTISAQPFPEAHFAVYPEKLITPAVLAGCPRGGLIIEPFDGAGTTRVVAAEHGRDCISFELKKEYIEISDKRHYDRTRQTQLDLSE